MKSRVGEKLVLHKVLFPDITNEKDEFVIVEIIEVKDIRDAWSDKIHKNAGLKAKSEDGRFFFCNWGNFPSDSASPYWMWFEADEDYTKFIREWADITQGLYNIPKMPSTLEGNGIVEYCAKHRTIYMKDFEVLGNSEGPSCFYCWLEWRYPENGDKLVHEKLPGGYWKGWE